MGARRGHRPADAPACRQLDLTLKLRENSVDPVQLLANGKMLLNKAPVGVRIVITAEHLLAELLGNIEQITVGEELLGPGKL